MRIEQVTPDPSCVTGSTEKVCAGWLLSALWPRFLARGALGNDGSAKPGAEVVGQFVQLGIAINFDGFLGCVADHIAVVAPGEVIFQFGLCASVNYAVQ